MKKKVVYGTLLTLLVTSTLTMAFKVEPAKAQETVRFYVKDPSDGDNIYAGMPVGTTFSVQVWIDSPSEWFDTPDGIIAYTVSVQVNPAILEPMGATTVPDLDSDGWSDGFLGEFCQYKEWTMGTLQAPAMVNKTDGMISGFAEGIPGGPAVGAGGSGVLMCFQFKSKSATEYSLIDLIHQGIYHYITIDALYTNARRETTKADVVQDGHYNLPLARVCVDPPTVYAVPGESFTVDVMIADVVNLYSWQVNMSFDPDVLTFVTVTEGDFLANQPEGTIGPYIATGVGWAMFCVLTLGPYPGVSGSGRLATVEFNVKAIGESVLNIADPMTKLLEMHLPPIPPGEPPYELIPYIAENGYFSNLTFAVPSTLDIKPDTLNLESKGQWITAYIQLPEGYNAADIEASTILLNETISPILDPMYSFVTNSSEYLVDHNNDGIVERMVKFNRTEVASWIHDDLGIQYGNVTLTVRGELLDGTSFEGPDTIQVLFPGDVDCDGDVDFEDFIIFAGCYGCNICAPRYNQMADLNEDGPIDFEDFIIFAGNYGKTAI